MDGQQALEQLDKQARRSKKFKALLLGASLTTAIGVAGVLVKADATLIGVILGHLVFLFSGYIGSTAWQDKAVRMAAVLKGDGANGH